MKYYKLQPPKKLSIYLLFHDIIFQFSLGFFFFCFLFSFAGDSYINFSTVSFLFNDYKTTTGVITSLESTGLERNNTLLMAYDYKFDHEVYGSFTGTSFKEFCQLQKGSKITVEYIADSPWINRVQGMSSSYASLPVKISWFFNALTIGLMIWGIYRSVKFLKLLENGTMTTAKLAKKPTAVMLDETIFYKLEFDFVSQNGESHKIKKEISHARSIIDDKEELLIYSDANPNKNYFVDMLPKKLKDYIYSNIELESGIKVS